MFETILSASIPAVALIIVQLIISMKQQRVQGDDGNMVNGDQYNDDSQNRSN